MGYVVPTQYIERYADLLVNYALGSGAGISRGDVVWIHGGESSKPLYAELCRAVWRAGGLTIGEYEADGDSALNLRREMFEIATPEQTETFLEAYWTGLADQVDHLVQVEAEADPRAMRTVDPARILARQVAHRPLDRRLDAKENSGAFSWTIAMYGTEAMATEAGLSLEQYWEQIIAACFLDEPDPKTRWRAVAAEIAQTVAALDALQIERLHVRGEDVDLTLTLGEQRRWRGGDGCNIPSFEIFTSPDWRGTEGWIRFSEPLYTHGNLVTGVELEFSGGRVTRASATENEPLLTEMIAAENADKVGEFSLTDARFSRITKFMASTLYDENVGGEHGNTHIAVGKAYQDCYDGDPGTLSDADWERLGFNESAVHTDIVSTTDREVTATLADGSTRVIYAGGRFRLAE